MKSISPLAADGGRIFVPAPERATPGRAHGWSLRAGARAGVVRSGLGIMITALGLAVGPGRALAQRPLGIDVSDYQGSINWSSVAGAGITFAWCKADEGTGGNQTYFASNETNAKANGIPIGCYHYARYDVNTGTSGAIAEANHFWSVAKNYIKGDGKSLMPMLDVEASTAGYTPATLSQWVNQWCTTVVTNAAAAGLTVKPVIYVSACHANYMDSSVSQWLPWIANYNGQDPQSGTPWSVCSGYNWWGTWDVWQYTSTGSIPGISGNVDHDVFNGTAATLISTLVIGGAGNGATVVSSSVPGGVVPGQTFSATITMNNSGGIAWTNTSATPYQLGSQTPQDNTTWGLSRVSLPSSPINPGQDAAFTFNATAPATPGNYTFAWRMIQGSTVFGDTFSTTINVGINGAAIFSSSVPSGVATGQTFTAMITMTNTGGTIWTNTGATPYRLGSQSPQDNTTWGLNRVSLPSSPVNPGQKAAFTFTATAPMAAGTYTFAWKMLQEPSTFFGSAFTTAINVVLPGPGTNLGSYTLDTGNMDSTSRNGSYVNFSSCSLNAWYSYGIPGVAGSSCTIYDRDIRWMPSLPTYGFTGRGYLTASTIVPSTHATATANFFAVDGSGTDLPGPITGTVNGCAYSCAWVTFYNGTPNVSSFGGFRSNTKDDGPPGSGGCSTTCGNFPVGLSQMHIQAARWQYIDDWVCLGGYSSTNVNDTQHRSFNEASLYLYPAVDTSHGNVLTGGLGLNGRTPGRVTTGDCNNANALSFDGSTQTGGNADAFGHCDNCDAYGFAWVFSPGGAGPQIVIGSDDGNRLWVNGTLANDNNSARGLTRDQDNTGAVGLPAGWSRILFKVHNFTGGFQGTVSLRNGSNVNLNEPSVNYYDLGGYYSYGLGYEQDGWYPQIVVASVYGASSPVNGAALYGNTTTVATSGTSNGQGPVPYWRTMTYQWGYGLGNADSNYGDVSGTPTSASWSHNVTGVTGHRRLHFFAVSQSGRTSFQDSGKTGGSKFQDAGNYARYYDVYVDNVAPQSPSFASVTAASPTEIDLGWAVPLDQGVNVAPGSDESAGSAGNQDLQNWYRVGDVGVQVYRNGAVISSWGGATAVGDTALSANTAYSYTLEARDNNTGARGGWHNSTGQEGSTTAWTLSVPPGMDSVTPSQTQPASGDTITWTAVGGFGPGTLQYYRYAWDQSPTHTWTDTEAQWSSGTITTVPVSAGNWYLHVKGYNGADVGNGTYDYAVTASQGLAPRILAIGRAGSSAVTLTWSAISGMTYRVEYNPNFSTATWSGLPPDVMATGSTASKTDNPSSAIQRFYRVVLLP